MGGMGGANAFGAGGPAGIGTGGGVDPADPNAPVNPMNLPVSAFNAPGTVGSAMGYQLPAQNQGPSTFRRIQGDVGRVANALQPLAASIPGSPQYGAQPQAQRQQNQNFNIPSQPYIAPPAPMSNPWGRYGS